MPGCALRWSMPDSLWLVLSRGLKLAIGSVSGSGSGLKRGPGHRHRDVAPSSGNRDPASHLELHRSAAQCQLERRGALLVAHQAVR